MAYSTLATQADTPTAGPDHTYFEAVAGNFAALTDAFGARISQAAAQQCGGGSSTYQVVLGTVDWDSSPTLTGTANRLTIPTSWGGLWLIAPMIVVQGQGAGAGATMQVKVRKNATTDVWDAFYNINGVSTVQLPMTNPFTLPLAATDYLEVFVVMVTMQTAASQPFVRNDLGCSLAASWLSP